MQKKFGEKKLNKKLSFASLMCYSHDNSDNNYSGDNTLYHKFVEENSH